MIFQKSNFKEGKRIFFCLNRVAIDIRLQKNKIVIVFGYSFKPVFYIWSKPPKLLYYNNMCTFNGV